MYRKEWQRSERKFPSKMSSYKRQGKHVPDRLAIKVETRHEDGRTTDLGP